jgi:peptide deformylase
MALYKLVYLPDQRLRLPTENVTVFDDKLKTLIEDMYETMYHNHGIGLAAPQIGLSLKIAVVDVSEKCNDKFCIINPQIIKSEGEVLLEEGCLSVPGVFDKAPRGIKVTVRAQDETGKVREISGDGILAHCLQHEIDHLNGKLFVDYLSPLKLKMARKKLAKNIRRK